MEEIGNASHSWEMARKPYRTAPQAHENNYVRERRQAKGWTLEKLASVSGLHTTTLSKIETGGREGRPKTFKKIAKAFNIQNWKDLLEPMAETEDKEVAAAVVKTLRERKAGNG